MLYSEIIAVCSVVWLAHINFFILVSIPLSLALLYVLYVSHKLNSVTLSSHLSVTHTICLHFHFSVSRPDMGRIQFHSIAFCL
jgi:hypothetical protein